VDTGFRHKITGKGRVIPKSGCRFSDQITRKDAAPAASWDATGTCGVDIVTVDKICSG
jgi:hypothetical protein